MKPSDLYVLSLPQTLENHRAAAEDGAIKPSSRVYVRSPARFKPSQCTPLFLSAFTRRGARCCIHTHSPWAVLVTLILENTAHEEDLTEFMEEAMEKYPDAYAVLVRRHGVYVWGNTVEQAKGQCERYVLPVILGP
jgi:methylthioribulose-1-phosphate dehydratase